MDIIASIVFGLVTGIAVTGVSGRHIKDWQWWAAILPILITETIT